MYACIRRVAVLLGVSLLVGEMKVTKMRFSVQWDFDDLKYRFCSEGGYALKWIKI